MLPAFLTFLEDCCSSSSHNSRKPRTIFLGIEHNTQSNFVSNLIEWELFNPETKLKATYQPPKFPLYVLSKGGYKNFDKGMIRRGILLKNSLYYLPPHKQTVRRITEISFKDPSV